MPTRLEFLYHDHDVNTERMYFCRDRIMCGPNNTFIRPFKDDIKDVSKALVTELFADISSMVVADELTDCLSAEIIISLFISSLCTVLLWHECWEFTFIIYISQVISAVFLLAFLVFIKVNKAVRNTLHLWHDLTMFALSCIIFYVVLLPDSF